ncbi:MAG TPA: hypothetical protein VHE35_18750 [Kofleriaceae bacterium]|nr:hypothetical protein [Kofleriaceae bacterium]
MTLAALVFGHAGVASADDTADALAKLRQGADCSNHKTAHKDWCMIEWDKGKAAAVKPGVMVGLSVGIEADTDVATALTDDVTPVVLRIDKDGPQLSANLHDVEGAPGITTKDVDALEQAIHDRLISKTHKVTLAKPVKAFVDSLKGQGTRALTKGKESWTWSTGHSNAELRLAGKYWVIIETPEDGSGRVITLLTDDVK